MTIVPVDSKGQAAIRSANGASLGIFKKLPLTSQFDFERNTIKANHDDLFKLPKSTPNLEPRQHTFATIFATISLAF
jgi:hypothetical protein